MKKEVIVTLKLRSRRVVGSALPKMKQTTLGLYVTAAQSYEMWKAAPDKVKIIDVRTPEEFAFVGHPTWRGTFRWPS